MAKAVSFNSARNFSLKMSVFLLTFATVSSNGDQGTRQAYGDLITHLLATADPRIPPNANNLSEPVDVTIQTMVPFLENLDTQEQMFSLYLVLYISWQDSSLAWNTTTYPVQSVNLLANEVWRPELTALNAIEPTDMMMKQEVKVTVSHSGAMRWTVSGRFSINCPINIQLFPFDDQVCRFILSSLTNSPQDVSMQMGPVLDIVSTHPEWEVQGIDQSLRIIGSWFYTLNIRLKRRWLSYVLNVLLPVLLVSGLNCLVFLLPVDCGEKMSVSVTAFLSLAVFMSFVQDKLPSNSDSVCYLTVYLGSQVVISVLGVILSAIVVKCHHGTRGASNVEERKVEEEEVEEEDQDAKDKEKEGLASILVHNGLCLGKAKGMTTFLNALYHGNRVHPEGAQITESIEEKRKVPTKKRRGINWPAVGQKIDRVCFPLFALLTILTFCVYIMCVAIPIQSV